MDRDTQQKTQWPIINVLSGFGIHAPILFSLSLIPLHFISHFFPVSILLFCIFIAGFGTPSGEYWIGNTILNHLTVDNCTTLKIIMQDIYDNTWEAVYSTFNVGSREDGYRLSISGYRYWITFNFQFDVNPIIDAFRLIFNYSIYFLDENLSQW